MSATCETTAPTGRKKIAQGKERSDAALGHQSQNTSSPEGAKENGKLPNGWRRVAIKDMADSIQYGLTASAAERKDGPRFLRITDIQDGRVDWSAVPSCNIPKEQIPKYKLSSGDLVFARTGATTGKSFLVGECPEAVFASYLIRVRVSADVDSRYLSAFFQSPDYWRQIEGGKRGIGQPNVNGTVLGEVQFPLAPPDEQRRIVAEIEKQFTRLEAGVAALRRVQANLKRYRAAVLKAACDGDWPRKPLGELIQTGRAMGYGVLKPGPHVPGGVRLLKSGQVRDGSLDLTEDYRISKDLDDEFKRTRLHGGELLLNLVGASIGRSAIATPELKGANVSRAIAVIPIFSERVKWVQIVLSSPDSQSGILGRRTGIAQPVLNLGQVKQLPIPLPPLAEQTRIVAEVERRLSVVEELESVVSANLQRATRLRQSILQKAFTGNL